MRKLVGNVLAVAVVAALVLVVFRLPLTIGDPVSGNQDSTFVCTIDSVATYYNIEIDAAVATLGPDMVAALDSDLATRAPGATVVDQRIGKLKSQEQPILYGRVAVLRQLADVPDGVIFGPAYASPEAARVSCAVAVYL